MEAAPSSRPFFPFFFARAQPGRRPSVACARARRVAHASCVPASSTQHRDRRVAAAHAGVSSPTSAERQAGVPTGSRGYQAHAVRPRASRRAWINAKQTASCARGTCAAHERVCRPGKNDGPNCEYHKPFQHS